ncbi:protein ENHANCED DISEASE RESISTANCE 2-like [Rhodamnia argentea]|uniref:Protein ENHANCED DISEASE RESISTANCE 2-like n=1 Tax=Rhodamnia argentea TaxID=178133 RepID=A0A8B8QDH7_9MYRT|nr:protein ENHANCED DISEASE RESISTANCE 2-like [Rhodamnia argentea]
MCTTKHHRLGSDPDHSAECSRSGSPDRSWIAESIHGGSLRRVDLHTGTNGWASPPGDVFSLRSKTYLRNRHKSPSGDYLLSPAGMDWLRSPAKLDNVLARPDNRVAQALRKAQSRGRSLKSFIFAVNLQVPGKDQHSAVFYFVAEEPIPAGSLLYRFVNEDDSFRNSRFKIVNRIVKGPWIVKKAVGNYSACLLGKALTCNYYRGENYFEIDVDIASSKIANAILHLALGYVTSVTIDMGFVVEAQAEDELPEKLIGAVRVCQMEMSSVHVVDTPHTQPQPQPHARGHGFARVNHHTSADEDEDDED